jgi:hypothetical protein
MSRFAFGLRYFLFGLGSALNTRKHLVWSIDLTQDCPNLCHPVCAILITPDTQHPAEGAVNLGRPPFPPIPAPRRRHITACPRRRASCGAVVRWFQI